MNLKLTTMLRWTIIFLFGAIVSAVFQFGNIPGYTSSITKPLYFIFIGLTILAVIFEEKAAPYKFIQTKLI